MTTFEVAEVLAQVPHRTWEGDKGSLHYFKVKLTDGTVAEAGKKKADTPPKVGDRYKTLRPLPDNAPQDALPTLQGPITDFQGGGQGDRGRNASMAVSYAKDLAIADKIELGQISVYAEKFFEFIDSKSRGGS
jgi:hypothetical protein